MIARMRKSMEEKDQGFTLIELLVVIIIIGILAAIAIPAFLRQRENAWGSQVTSDIKNAVTAAESYAVEHNGSYTGLEGSVEANGVPSAVWDAAGLNGTEGVTIDCQVQNGGNTYTLTGSHAQRGADQWTYDSETGRTDTP